MPDRCSIIGCNSGYDSQRGGEKVTIYKFPADAEERGRWIKAIPQVFDKVTDYMGVCRLHWPESLSEWKKPGRFRRPAVPPSVFHNDGKEIPASCFQTPTAPPRKTMNSTTDIRARAGDVDQTPEHNRRDSLESYSFVRFSQEFIVRFSKYGAIGSDEQSKQITLISKARKRSIHSYSLYFTVCLADNKNVHSVKCEAYYRLRKAPDHTLYRDNVVKLWSQLEEIERFYRVNCDEREYIDLYEYCSYGF